MYRIKYINIRYLSIVKYLIIGRYYNIMFFFKCKSVIVIAHLLKEPVAIFVVFVVDLLSKALNIIYSR